jgi:hypothetical protein
MLPNVQLIRDSLNRHYPHTWAPTIVQPAVLVHPQRAEVRWWPHCASCGTQICKVGGKHYYRETSSHEWSPTEPVCIARRLR